MSKPARKAKPAPAKRAARRSPAPAPVVDQVSDAPAGDAPAEPVPHAHPARRRRGDQV